MSTTVALRDVVGEAENAFLVRLVPLQCHFDTDTIPFSREMEDIGVQRRLVAVQVFDERADAALILEKIFTVTSFVSQMNADTGIEEREFTQTFRQNIVVKFGVGEDLGTGVETHLSSSLFTVTGGRQRTLGHPKVVNLVVLVTFAPDGQLQFFGQGVHYGHTNTVQPSRYLVRVVVKFSARM